MRAAALRLLRVVPIAALASIAAAADLAALPDRPVALRLDDVPLEVALELLLEGTETTLSFDPAKAAALDLRHEGTLHGLLERLGTEHGLRFVAVARDGAVGVTVDDAPDGAPPTPSGGDGPDADATPSAEREPAAREVDDIPGFDTF